MLEPLSLENINIESKNQLIEYAVSGCKSRKDWKIGTEHEKFLYNINDFSSLTYDGSPGVRTFLEELMRFGWDPVLENNNLIGLKRHGGGSITLEPGGQLELSGAQLMNIHETCAEVQEHRREIVAVAKDLGIGLLSLGMTPHWTRDDVHWMPKGRYNIMRNYMPTVGSMGLDMMTRTSTVQVNLDYESETDMVKKMRVAIALQPIATALWANSPFTDGKVNGNFSQRALIWQNTDNDRTGMMPFVFTDGMGFEKYVDYVLDVPMYFIRRDNYIDVAGQSFRQFMHGKLPQLPGQLPTMSDWEDHLSTVFPEVRLKKFLEMRGADSGPWERLCALPAFWIGLLYDESSLDAAWHLIKNWSEDERDYFYKNVPIQGLKAKVSGISLWDISKEILKISISGLKNRACIGLEGKDESSYLSPLEEIVLSGETPAEKMLNSYYKDWESNIENIFSDYSY